jgi:hypothetical protein
MADEMKVKIERADDFADLYANNVRFESSVWDLKLLFGNLDLSNTPPEIISLHTSVTIPWPTAKIAAYLLAMNVVLHQSEQGNLNVPQRVLPPRPDPDNPDLAMLNKEVIKYIAWIWDQFFGANPHIPDGVETSKLSL